MIKRSRINYKYCFIVLTLHDFSNQQHNIVVNSFYNYGDHIFLRKIKDKFNNIRTFSYMFSNQFVIVKNLCIIQFYWIA